MRLPGPGRFFVLSGLAMILVVAFSGCSAAGPGGDGLEGTVLVSAAASLGNAFTDIEAAFEELHPRVDVVLNLGASSTLREQILEGAPADVFASANQSNMAMLVEAGDVAGEPTVFAHNLLQIVVPAGNPGGVTGLADFGREELLIGLCAQGAPCGEGARTALHNAGVTPVIDTAEPDVRALITKIEAGELDAAITYLTDVFAAGGSVDGVEIPEDVNVIAEYPIALLAGSTNPDAAAAFVEFVLSRDGQAILAEYRFASP